MFSINFISLISYFVLGIIGWITYKIFIWPFYISPLRKIPGPPSESSLYGNLKTLMTEESGVPQLRWIKKYGNVIKYHGLFNNPILLITDTKLVQEITLNKAYDFIKPLNASGISLIGRGLIYAEGDDHKRQRKLSNPAFTYSNVKEMVPSFVRIGSTLKGLIEEKLNSGETNINLTPYISKATLDVIGLVGFNYEFNSLTSQNELAIAYDSIFNNPVTTLRIVLNLLSNYVPSVREIPLEANKRFKNACATIDRVSKRLVEERYNEAKNGELKGKDLLSLLININNKLPAEEKMTDDELKYQIMTFLFAGHETTSISTCWALYSLAQHPHEQDLLREELVKAFPDKSKFNPTYDEINSLEYLNCIVKESLRLNAPASNIRRINLKDEVLGNYFIPKNTEISLSISTIHKLPEIWGPTADDFDPKRWLDPSLVNNISNLNYLPFYNGPRNCIGSKVALTEFKILLGILIRNFVFKPIEGFHIRKRAFPAPKPDPYLGLAVSIVES
ncbi:cytochrome P450 [Rhizophagus irregularis]|uniref:Cytochrome P450 n=1 Tax=Rhizophagus irregularis TaxID=588596 RepID=A0A2N0SEB1_9GLOM|nr:cytochrome P450 [Rhizophagus irregularis]